ncbi:hypothetical protein AK812_SmicGene42846 [Symbiodinium microadriaticum]|uniref:Uncharacterized protein n=1 Tax=Symbiodinium microadriaticum TaxID=2951 RepID=A0A1Q9C2K0_SYMMI|nr:hypothetical protein AK812_SmicGene42846 [Symbiodinium microadriaticum]
MMFVTRPPSGPEREQQCDEHQQKQLRRRQALKLAKAVDDDILVMHSQQVVAKTRIMSFRHWEAEEPVQEASGGDGGMEEASLFLLKAQIHICNGEDDKAQEEQAREIIDGDYLRQREQEGVDKVVGIRE